MTHVLGRVFLVATLLLPLWRGDGLGAVQTKRGWVNMVDAATSTVTTKKTKDVVLGEVIQIGTSKFVKIAANRFQAVEPYACADPVLTYAGAVKKFDYTGGEQTYMAHAGCQYKLEVWGAEGGYGVFGTSADRYGGYGGYSIGVYESGVNTSFHIYVGSKGGQYGGGYNGGGTGSYSRCDEYSGGGGGATHVALDSGLLKTLAGHLADGRIIIVAAGGGGGSTCGGIPGKVGGNGGGYVGCNNYIGSAIGASQTATGSWTSNLGRAGGFGYGGDGYVYGHICESSGGGGGGYYGGVASNESGSGGSGYIGSSNLLSAAGVTKHMTCYNCTTSTVDATRTQSNTCVSGTSPPKGRC